MDLGHIPECSLVVILILVYVYFGYKQDKKAKAIKKAEAMAKQGHRWHHNMDPK